MIMVSTKFNMTLPKFNFQEDLRKVAQNIIIPNLAENMDRQITIQGKPYPALEPETIARKKGQALKRAFTKSGKLREVASKTIGKVGLGAFSAKTLFQTGKLYRSFKFRNVGKAAVIVYLNNDRQDVGKALQVDGVGNKKKRFKFFGISKKMTTEAMNYMKKKVKEELARRGTR